MDNITYRCVLICEDIRQETGGRVSLMGILGAKLFVQEFPLMFPKFCLFVEWGEITGKMTVTLNIVPPPGVSTPKIKPTAVLQGQPGVVARSMIVIPGFVFPQAGTYYFEFLVNDKAVGREPFTVERFDNAPKVTN